MGRLDGKVALITGAGSGFGRASGILFAKEGAKVAVVDYVPEGGEETVRVIKEAGGEAIFVNADVSKTEDVKRMIRTTVDTYGKLDILFNNAGVAMGQVPLTETTEEQWNRDISINLTGVWLGMKYAIPEMTKRGGGVIISTASVAGFMAVLDVPVEYNVSKAGVIILTKVAAAEFADQNIRVNCICPGNCVTPQCLNYNIERAVEGREVALRKMNAMQLIGRMGRAEEIAQVALFLACDDSSFVTGEALVADGGHSVLARGEPIPTR